MRVFITGDTHGLLDVGKLEVYNFAEGYQLTKEDIVIITGDAGIIWDEKTDAKKIEYYESKPWTTVYIDGNHENFPLIDQYPVVEFYGAKANKISDSIYRIKRGEIMELNGKSFFCFGGGFSHDVICRILNRDWFREEVPTQGEVDNAIRNLERYDNKVDFIITHDVPTIHNMTMGFQNLKGRNIMGKYREEDVDVLYIHICDFLQSIFEMVTYKSWVAGHYHIDEEINGIQILYNSIAEITDENEQGYRILEAPVSNIMGRTYTEEELKFRFQMEGLFMNYRKVGTYLDFGVREMMMKAAEFFDYEVDEKAVRRVTKLYNEYKVRQFEKEFYDSRKEK